MKNLLPITLIVFFALHSFAQDIPLFSQKLTNNSMYNPAVAGHTLGTATVSYRSNYERVNDAPKQYLLSVHAPFSNHRFGVGTNIYQEDVSVLRNTYYSAAFAYHVPISYFNTFSVGVSGEVNQWTQRFDAFADPYIASDQTFQRYLGTSGKPDFSFGILYQTRYVKFGASANRLATAWLTQPDKKNLANYFTTTVQGIVPMRRGLDLLEPFFSYRKFSETNNTVDVGAYYTYDNKITAGGAFRNGSIAALTLAYRLNRFLQVGYSRETILTPIGGFIGSSNEIVLRVDFKDQDYQKKYRQTIAYCLTGVDPTAAKKPTATKSDKGYSRNDRSKKQRYTRKNKRKQKTTLRFRN